MLKNSNPALMSVFVCYTWMWAGSDSPHSNLSIAFFNTFHINWRAIMAKKMDFVEFVSDLPDEEGDAPEADLAEESIPPGVYYKVDGSRVVLLKDEGCKKKQ